MNSFRNWVLEINPSVLKFLRKIPRSNTEAVLKVVKFLSVDLYFGDVQKMKGEDNVWRRRVGDYRIFYKTKQQRKLYWFLNQNAEVQKLIKNNEHKKLEKVLEAGRGRI